ncbi:DUF3857 domain-containing protein [Microvirga tunisiensis]|uniref:DUF3857 domain-containing protein n=1 Tax=Pannonibacter tanglangensis TaxID=2750084 RepID=A0A7X5F0U9_9HYPH|nr:DUF3857 domain-containing protein [Pannonibacter sp. XCT-53]NBN77707.1 DUF3857 domain-containing protein [Pannonibacter sp. XCT-53]
MVPLLSRPLAAPHNSRVPWPGAVPVRSALAASVLVLLLALAGTPPAHAASTPPSGIAAQAGPQQEARIGPRPDWVDLAPIPEPDPELELQVSDGVYILMIDDQKRWDGAEETVHRRRVRQVIDRSGLEAASTIQMDFDPSRETLTLNSVRIRRNGVWRDVTQDTRLEILRQEDQLGNGILAGQLTLLAILPNVQVDDTIDYEMTVVDSRPLFRGAYASSAGFSTDFPIGFLRSRVSIPAGRQAVIRLHGRTDQQPETVTADGYTITRAEIGGKVY